MNQKLYDLIEANPVIAAVKDMEGLDACCKRDEIKVVFILFGDICNISAIVGQIKESDKVAMVHIDLITGLSSKEVAVDFIRNNTSADGIISTKPALIKRARELSLYTTLRVFVLDSMAFENIEKQMSVARHHRDTPGTHAQGDTQGVQAGEGACHSGGTYIRQGRCDGSPVSRGHIRIDNESEGMADVNIEA